MDSSSAAAFWCTDGYASRPHSTAVGRCAAASSRSTSRTTHTPRSSARASRSSTVRWTAGSGMFTVTGGAAGPHTDPGPRRTVPGPGPDDPSAVPRPRSPGRRPRACSPGARLRGRPAPRPAPGSVARSSPYDHGITVVSVRRRTPSHEHPLPPRSVRGVTHLEGLEAAPRQRGLDLLPGAEPQRGDRGDRHVLVHQAHHTAEGDQLPAHVQQLVPGLHPAGAGHVHRLEGVLLAPPLPGPHLRDPGLEDQVATGSKGPDRKSTRLHSSHVAISYAVFCLKKKRIIAL